jgi:hypothetical protein
MVPLLSLPVELQKHMSDDLTVLEEEIRKFYQSRKKSKTPEEALAKALDLVGEEEVDGSSDGEWL